MKCSRVYAHLTPTDAVNDMNKRMGIETEHKRDPLPDVATPVQCGKCFSINSKEHLFCGFCGNSLSEGMKEAFDTSATRIEDSSQYKHIMEDLCIILKLEGKRGEVWTLSTDHILLIRLEIGPSQSH